MQSHEDFCPPTPQMPHAPINPSEEQHLRTSVENSQVAVIASDLIRDRFTTHAADPKEPWDVDSLAFDQSTKTTPQTTPEYAQLVDVSATDVASFLACEIDDVPVACTMTRIDELRAIYYSDLAAIAQKETQLRDYMRDLLGMQERYRPVSDDERAALQQHLDTTAENARAQLAKLFDDAVTQLLAPPIAPSFDSQATAQLPPPPPSPNVKESQISMTWADSAMAALLELSSPVDRPLHECSPALFASPLSVMSSTDSSTTTPSTFALPLSCDTAAEQTAVGTDFDRRSQNPPKRNPLPKAAILALNTWFMANFANPYPTTEEAELLAVKGGITPAQVQTWMTNKRARGWKPKIVSFELNQDSTQPPPNENS